jgi:hypothetical protein
MTGYHESCKPTIVFYEKTWHCSCEKCFGKKQTNDDQLTEKETSDEETSQLAEELPNEELASSSNPNLQD